MDAVTGEAQAESTIGSQRDLNVLVGDNEAGKSTILLAMDLAVSGSRSNIEALGIETLSSAFEI